jgi:hypothetical protein
VKAILDCARPNIEDDIIFCTRTWDSDSSVSASEIREGGFGGQSNCDSEVVVSSHDSEQATASTAEDFDTASQNRLAEPISIETTLSNGNF